MKLIFLLEGKVIVFRNKRMQKTAALHTRNKYPRHIVKSLSKMSDFFVILNLQISYVLQYTPDFQIIETSNPNILTQTLDFIDRHYIVIFLD